MGLYWMLLLNPHPCLVGVGNYYHFTDDQITNDQKRGSSSGLFTAEQCFLVRAVVWGSQNLNPGLLTKSLEES